MRSISEKGNADKIGENRHAIRQLQRRPAGAAASVIEYAYAVETGFSIADTGWNQYELSQDPSGDFDGDTPTFARNGTELEVGKGGVYEIVWWIQPDSTNPGVVTEIGMEVQPQGGGASWESINGVNAVARSHTVRLADDTIWDVPIVKVPFAVQQGSVDGSGPLVLQFLAQVLEDGANVTRNCSIWYWLTRFGPLYSGS